MFSELFKKIKPEVQGMAALILGLFLILGTLGKLQILQGILNTIMILVGTILIIWGLNTGSGLNKIKALFHINK
jgi:hypothetical protein